MLVTPTTVCSSDETTQNTGFTKSARLVVVRTHDSHALSISPDLRLVESPIVINHNLNVELNGSRELRDVVDNDVALLHHHRQY